MTTELATLQNELLLARLEKAELKYELEKVKNELLIKQAEKVSKLEDSLFSSNLEEHYYKVATRFAKTSMVPNCYKGKPEDIMVAMSMGYQLGLSIEQSLQDIAIINGKPCLWGDGLLALAQSHPECESIQEEPIYDTHNNVMGYRCIVRRKGYTPRTQEFTLQDAQAAGLLSKQGPWTQYPKRMLQMRARAFALRDMFSDALRGLKIAEEQQDAVIIEAEAVVDMPAPTTQTEKLKQILGITPEPVIGDAIIEETIVEPEAKITDEQLIQIEELFVTKALSNERIAKALELYQVNTTMELTSKKAHRLINQLEKL